MYFHVPWEQPGPLTGKTQSNSTVALWRYNFGVVSIAGRDSCGVDGAHCSGSSTRRAFYEGRGSSCDVKAICETRL